LDATHHVNTHDIFLLEEELVPALTPIHDSINPENNIGSDRKTRNAQRIFFGKSFRKE
jgi:hypothetical protein